MIHSQRIKPLNKQKIRKGSYVLYWMQAAQRAEWNHALEYAVDQANESGLPLVTLFGITETFPEANERHYAFMLEGISETQRLLEKRGIQLVVCLRSPEQAVISYANKASLIVTDTGYLRIQKQWRNHVAENVNCLVIQVETDVIVPLGVASIKEEYAARTLRPKINKVLEKYLVPLKKRNLKRDSLGLRFDKIDVKDPHSVLAKLSIDTTVSAVSALRGGTINAKKLLSEFLRTKLDVYAVDSNDPGLQCVSRMSPYLHFGQISPLYIALEIMKKQNINKDSREAYLEQLIIRRELSMNFVNYSKNYDSYNALPEWAQRTLQKHAGDTREFIYDIKDFETARTHDPYWNAAMNEMLYTGMMHNYMRMYWGKKIIEWTKLPREAFKIMLYLNNKYFLDGRDPNSFTGVAWCFGKHDRPWTERNIFGTVRYMNAAGLERKFDMQKYLRYVNEIKI